MKTQLLLFSAIVFTSITTSAQDTFLKKYPSPQQQEILSIIETDDNHLIFCGSKAIDSGIVAEIGFIAKINMNGDLVNSKTYDFYEGNSFFTGLRKNVSSNGQSFLLGVQDSIANGQTFNSVFIHTVDNELNILVRRYYDIRIDRPNFPLEMEILGDTIAYILSLIKDNPGIRDYSLIRADLLRNNFIYYSPNTTQYKYPSGLIIDEINNLVKVNYYAMSTKPIANISTDLTLIEVVLPENDFFTQTRIGKKNDSVYLLSGSFFENLSLNRRSKQELGIAKYNMNDSLLIQVHLPGNEDTITYPGGGNSILVTADYIWAVGWYNVIPQLMLCSPSPTWVVLNKLNHDLVLIEQLFYGGDGVYVPRDIIETSDQHIVVTGEYYDPFLVPYECQFDPFVLKVNSEGLIVSSQSHDLPIAQEAIVFPNPGSGYLQVKLAVQHRQAALQLFDMNGRLMLDKEINTDLQQVNTSSLAKGIYPYRITAKGKVIGNGKWVKE
ncbi:MAG: T9SS type A sorting domain-containing protein [Lentimicrobiaceae bacterium]|jgi:hypothetical protein|nr:T9SS type A sorting domain-containing protein [Lentimicrobiaceae bacterium]